MRFTLPTILGKKLTGILIVVGVLAVIYVILNANVRIGTIGSLDAFA